jgi:hypothetical protein
MRTRIALAAVCAAGLAAPVSAQDCGNYQRARDQIYGVLGGPIMAEFQKKGVQSKERLNMAMQALAAQYRDEIAAGDKFAPLKFVGLRVIMLPYTGEPVDAKTRADACAMVAAEPDSKIVLVPLGCAAMLLDGAGKDDAAARGEARAALATAQARLKDDPNGEGAIRLLADVAPGIAACAAE